MQDNIQLTHKAHQPSGKKFRLSIIANDMTSPLNVGSLFRLCDAMGIEKLYLCGKTPSPPNSKLNKTSRSAEKYVKFEIRENAESLVSQLKASGTYIVALEATTSSIALNSTAFSNAIKTRHPICLILGAENTGVSDRLLSLSDLTTHIPMHGYNSSMNVISAASIASYEIIRSL